MRGKEHVFFIFVFCPKLRECRYCNTNELKYIILRETPEIRVTHPFFSFDVKGIKAMV